MRKRSISLMSLAMSHRAVQRVTYGIAMMTLAITACSPSSLVDVQSPGTVVDPAVVKTASGAIQLRRAALSALVTAYAGFDQSGTPVGGLIGYSGLLTDELTCGAYDAHCFTDRRTLSGAVEPTYAVIQRARVAIHLAREALLAYAPPSASAPAAWQGELYALEGYTVLWFAENYCSGIPLTVVPLVGKQTPTRGFTTEELYGRAIALFDSAAVLGADSTSYVRLAMMGKGRALLGLGQFAAADSAISDVPTDFVYAIASDSNGTSAGRFYFPINASRDDAPFRVQDQEGGTGLVWSTDIRTAVMAKPDDPAGFLRPAKYNVNENGQVDPTQWHWGVPVRLADGLEARLIQAEAALARGDVSWLTILNDLRSHCVAGVPCAPVPGLTADALPPLADPGSDTARVSLLMRERAMWLYITAHREADLRRLANVYHRDPAQLWPTGVYHAPAFPSLDISNSPFNGTSYGRDVVLGPDDSEQADNPLYGGCYSLTP